MLQELTYKKLPKLYKHLQTTQCEMSIIATDWFLCLFATTLPSEVTTPWSVALLWLFYILFTWLASSTLPV